MKFLLSAVVFVAGCAGPIITAPGTIAPMNEREYQQLIKKHTRGVDQYSGFYQTFQADVTILTSEVQAAALRQKGALMQWDEKQYQAEREKVVQEASNSAKYFIRFFTPEHDNDDLNKPKTIWKIFLEFNGNKYEGKVKKMTDKLAALQTLYPYIDRFSTPYEVTFNVPMKNVESGESKVLITSSIGQAQFVFPASK